ncbi:MAG TPA: 4Fe-4S binding protein, partial [Beijerinckiaceae bacterium]|nr:4Fe-4S binding protein [Beijerinckiaceae bacterium]
PPRGAEYPVYSGIIRSAKGRLGAFELTVDSFAPPVQGMRGPMRFGPPRNGASSTCDLILDVSGRMPLFSAHELRPGYLRASPGDRAAIERLIAEARDLVGTFDKPRYVAFKPELCAHSRSRITGCTRCLDICPTGAITPDGDSVAIDPGICGGCGGCSALCPTGAASYALPAPDHAIASLRTLLTSYFAAGGQDPVVLVHDHEHGEEMIHLLAHAGAGLPARVLPLAVNEVTALGLEAIAAAFAYGATALRVLARARPRHDDAPLRATLTMAGTILSGLGFSDDAASVIATDDADTLGAALRAIGNGAAAIRRASFLPAGTKRQLQWLALRELHAIAPAPKRSIALPAGAPMGRVTVASDDCTLCLACVSACPAEALRSNPERPELKFSEDLCVQCGLCAATCPEKVISLEPRLDFDAIDAGPIVLKQEDPHACERCGKLFGTRSTIARIRDKLAASHWMFTGAHADRMKLIGLCEDCRVIAATEAAIDPYAGAPRPKPRTAEDYRRVSEGIDLDPQGKKDTGV